MILNIFIIVALIAVAIGSYTDIKTLEVPDWLNYSLIAVGLAANLIFTIYTWNPVHILKSLTGLGVSIILGILMFYTGQWGGGDSKMIMAMGSLIGLNIFNLDFLVSAHFLEQYFLSFELDLFS